MNDRMSALETYFPRVTDQALKDAQDEHDALLDDAVYVAMREEFIRIIDDADSCIHAQPSKESLATTLVRAARAALAAADQEEKP